eukprot:3995038-Amphidinium_carterae.1
MVCVLARALTSPPVSQASGDEQTSSVRTVFKIWHGKVKSNPTPLQITLVVNGTVHQLVIVVWGSFPISGIGKVLISWGWLGLIRVRQIPLWGNIRYAVYDEVCGIIRMGIFAQESKD